MKYEAIKKYRKTKKGVLINIYDHIKRRNKDKFGLELNFTSKDFKDKYIDDENFLNAYNSWVESGYEYYKKPSADRILINHILLKIWNLWLGKKTEEKEKKKGRG